MDKVDLVLEHRDNVQEEETWEKLTNEVNVSGIFDSSPASYKWLKFGNTGLEIQVGQTKSFPARFDFIPEGKSRASPQTNAKYASMLASGLFSLYNFLNDHDRMADNEISSYNLPWIYATTNTRLVVAIQNLFSHYDISELISVEDNLSRVGISLKGFRNLKPDSPLILYLEKLSQRASNMKVLAQMPFDQVS